MQIKILKNFRWSHGGRIVNYKEGQVIEVTSKDALSMIKHQYAESFVEPEGKMFKHEVIEDKMMHFEIENKSDKPVNNKKSKKQKEVENE